MAGILLELVKGSSRDFQLQAQDTDGNPATIFLDTDLLSTAVFAGTEEVVLLSPATSWVSSPVGIYQVSFNDADTLALAEGVYRLQVTATRSGRGVVILDGSFKLLASTGTTPLRPVYCTLADMRKLAPWIDDIQDQESDSEGFAEQCADAREWLDECIIRNWRGTYTGQFGEHSQALASWNWAGPQRSLLRNKWLEDYLNKGALLLTTAGGKRLVRVCAFYALSQICQANFGKGKEYPGRAEHYLQQAYTLLVSSTAEIDTNGDGIAEIPINFSSANVYRT